MNLHCSVVQGTLSEGSEDLNVLLALLLASIVILEGFPDSSVEKNLPSNAGDTGSISDPARSHMSQSHSATSVEPGL